MVYHFVGYIQTWFKNIIKRHKLENFLIYVSEDSLVNLNKSSQNKIIESMPSLQYILQAIKACP